MNEQKGRNEEREYIAFISYRHKPLDTEAARRIQKRIETYRVPKEFRDRVGGKRLGMVFRDEDELPASASLSGSITYALDHSKYLLVICTPDLPKSAWCEQEIRHFLQTHDRDHLLAILVDGEPEESFSPLMLHTFDEEGNITGDTEPLAANIAGKDHSINKKSFRKEIVRVFSALLACPFDALWQRQRRAQASRMTALMATVMAVLAVFSGMVFLKNKQITARNEQIMAQNEQIVAQNEQITGQNQEISEKNQTLRQQLSAILVENGKAQLADHDVLGSLQSALEALPQEPGQPYDPRAEALLAKALCAYQTDTVQSRIIYSQGLEIVDLAVTEDENFALLADPIGYVRCVSLRDGALKWEALSRETPKNAEADTDLLVPAGKGLVIAKNEESVLALDLETGEPVWRYDYKLSIGSNVYCLSPDGKTLLLLDQMDWSVSELTLVALDAATGAVRGRTTLGGGETPLSLLGTAFRYEFGLAFSEDGRYVGFSSILENAGGLYYCALVDTKTWEIVHSREYSGAESTHSAFFYGIAVENGTGNLVCVQYETGFGGVLLTRINWAEDSLSSDLINKTKNSRSGLLLNALEEEQFLPMLTDREQAVLFVQESMYLIELPSGQLRKGYAFQSPILSARWEDRTAHSLVLMTADGMTIHYTLGYGGETVLRGAWTEELDQSGLSLGLALDRENENGLYLTVPSAHRDQLLAVRSVSDPDVRYLDDPKDGYPSDYRVLPSPSGERLFCIYPSYREAVVILRDTATLKEISRRTVAFRGDTEPMALDEDHLIVGMKIYGMDGSEAYLETMNQGDEDKYLEEYFPSAATYDGHALTARYCYYRDSSQLIPCWLDGALVPASQDPGTGIAFRSCYRIAVGENGFVAGYGSCAEFEENGGMRPASKEAFYVFDACRGTRLRVEDPFPEEGEREITLGRSTPVMACMDEACRIYVISLTDGSASLLPADYAAGEVKSLCFSPNDAWLAVMTQSGRLDIYALPAGERVFSEIPSAFASQDLSKINELRMQTDREGKALLLQTDYINDPCGFFLVVDPESWTVLAQAEKVYAYVSADDGVYAQRDSKMVRFPFRRLEDLAELARAELASVQ